jgi:hypothetical protein
MGKWYSNLATVRFVIDPDHDHEILRFSTYVPAFKPYVVPVCHGLFAPHRYHAPWRSSRPRLAFGGYAEDGECRIVLELNVAVLTTCVAGQYM